MDQKIIIASADEYIKKIEENNTTMEINTLEEVLVDGSIPPVELEDIPSLEDDYPSLEDIRYDFKKTTEAAEKDLQLSKPEKQPELQETNDVQSHKMSILELLLSIAITTVRGFTHNWTFFNTFDSLNFL